MSEASPAGEYVVVARRYRPQRFDELVGQEHVAQALQGAIVSGRVGHAYLFTGARGVGKTSAARILAKCLNCERGTSPTACGLCEICQSVAAGDDVDVLEIDGASNRGIDEIRQIRQNVAVRPSRARYKIYIIDEVHMLSRDAFNALLKTLEEPPEHVKFIFATTEVNKIPITILSRCQRFDFAGIHAGAIQARLAEIAGAEGVEADVDALTLISIRAAGSMRDSQSLLEQLLSTGSPRITAADVTSLLGLAPAARLSRLVRPLCDRDPAAALTEFDAALADGAEAGQLIDQLLGYLRDVLTQAVGCSAEQLLYALPAQREEIVELGRTMGVDTLLAMCQVLDHTAARMRVSTQERTLAELALVRLCRLQDLDELAAVVEQFRGEALPASAVDAKKNGMTAARQAAPPAREALSGPPTRATSADAREPLVAGPAVEPKSPSPTPASAMDAVIKPPASAGKATDQTAVSLRADTAEDVWRQTLDRLVGLVAESAAAATRISVDRGGRLVASFPNAFYRDICQRNLPRLLAALEMVCGAKVGLELTTHEPSPDEAAPAQSSPAKQQAELATHPFVERAIELFDGDPSRVRVTPAPASN